uniref:BioF2-like acetyltransferase domain-containing protein n=3 Tax=unclassified Prevotella TaxID=2638335 RepID=A0AB33JGZ0_9BACT
MFEIKRYSPAMKEVWDGFVKASRQGTFLFLRDYMDYHRNRFSDFSLMVYSKKRLFAVLPANRDGNTLYSHQGLTYGGLLTQYQATAQSVCDVFQSANDYLQREGICRVVYKVIPWIYHQIPSEEDLYALIHVCKAQLIARDISSTLFPSANLRFAELRRRGCRKALQHQLAIEETSDFAPFWDVLNANLQSKYHTAPVHTLEEMGRLRESFPQNIRLFVAREAGETLAGVLVYVSSQVVHVQYISASPRGKALGALDLLFDVLIHHTFKDMPYFDFGKSTEQLGNYLNTNLIFQKEGFGGRGVCYDWYEWQL